MMAMKSRIDNDTPANKATIPVDTSAAFDGLRLFSILY
jgi:hypothetical protein